MLGGTGKCGEVPGDKPYLARFQLQVSIIFRVFLIGAASHLTRNSFDASNSSGRLLACVRAHFLCQLCIDHVSLKMMVMMVAYLSVISVKKHTGAFAPVLLANNGDDGGMPQLAISKANGRFRACFVACKW